MDDAWTVASYLADADLLLASFQGMLTRHNETENVLQSAAASVAVRGVLYGNFHPSPSRFYFHALVNCMLSSKKVTFCIMEPLLTNICYYARWHAIRRPNLWQIERSVSHNQVD